MSEEISALIDREIDEECLVDLIDELCHKPELIERWQQYQLMRSAVRGECTRTYFDSVYARSEKLTDLIDEPSAIFTYRRTGRENSVSRLRQRWGSWVGGFGLAAGLGVAAAVGFVSSSLFEFQFLQSDRSYTAGIHENGVPVKWTNAANLAVADDSSVVYLNESLLAHSEAAGFNGLSNYARMVSYDR